MSNTSPSQLSNFILFFYILFKRNSQSKDEIILINLIIKYSSQNTVRLSSPACGFNLDCHRVTVPSGIFPAISTLQKSTCQLVPRSLALMLFTWCDWVIVLPHPVVVSRWFGGNVSSEAPAISDALWELFFLCDRSTSSSSLLSICGPFL